MSFDSKPLGGALSIVVAVGCAFVLLFGHSAKAQPVLRVKVFDTTTQSGAQNTVIPIYMSNYQDSIAGFNLWIQLDRPDILIFQTDGGTVVDTTYWDCLEYEETICVESVLTNPLGQWDFIHIDTNDILIGNFDTTGTLCSGWEWLDARSLSNEGFDLNIAGIADMKYPPDITPSIGPQQGGILIKILADVFEIPDSMTERTVNLMIQHNTLAHFSFSRPDGTSIGILHREEPDTNCWRCEVWVEEVCMDWERISTPPDCDSIGSDFCCPDSFEIVMDSVPYLDTIHVILEDGSVTVAEFICADADASGDINVADLIYLVNFLFFGGPPPQPMASGNVDCQGGESPNVADLTYFVTFMFFDGPAPCDC